MTAWFMSYMTYTADSIPEKSIAHNGSKLTCNIKSHSDYVPKHATSQRGGQVNESPDFMSYLVSSTLQNASKCCHGVNCINIMSM